ncbi:MAG: hypothetical protein JKY65_06660 [Planctomycetes bacterium]|nr:hypothetical protein [Planctomycetota bacterium]
MRRLVVRGPQARAREKSTEDPWRLLWQGHAGLARGDADAALRSYEAALGRLKAPPALTGVHYELPIPEADLRWELLCWRGVARQGSGDADGWRDLETAIRERPDHGLAFLESLGTGVPRTMERRAALAVLAALGKDADPLLRAIATRMSGDLRGLQLRPSWDMGKPARQRVLIRLHSVLAGTRGDQGMQDGYRRLLTNWDPEISQPRRQLPRVLFPLEPPPGVTFEGLCAPESGVNPGKRALFGDLRRANWAIGIRPQDARGWMLRAVSLASLGAGGLAYQSCREVLRLDAPPEIRRLALGLLARQALALSDRSAHRRWVSELRALKESPQVVEGLERAFEKKLAGESPR